MVRAVEGCFLPLLVEVVAGVTPEEGAVGGSFLLLRLEVEGLMVVEVLEGVGGSCLLSPLVAQVRWSH